MGFYQSSKWIGGISKAYGLKKYSVWEDQDHITFIEIDSALFGHRLISLPFCEYSDTVTLSEKLLAKIKILKQITKADYFEIRMQSKYNVLQLNNEFSTFSISGNSPQDIWDHLDRKLRNQIRKSEENFHLVKNNWEDFYPFYLLQQTRRGSPIHSRKFFELTGLQLYSAYVSEPNRSKKIASAVLIGQDGPALNWWGNINDPNLRNLNGTSWLLWNIIWEKFQTGFTFDLGRTRPGPIRNYKKQWGGTEKPIYTLTDIQTKKLDPTERWPQLASMVWKRLPLGIAELIGPEVIKGTGL